MYVSIVVQCSVGFPMVCKKESRKKVNKLFAVVFFFSWQLLLFGWASWRVLSHIVIVWSLTSLKFVFWEQTDEITINFFPLPKKSLLGDLSTGSGFWGSTSLVEEWNKDYTVKELYVTYSWVVRVFSRKSSWDVYTEVEVFVKLLALVCFWDILGAVGESDSSMHLEFFHAVHSRKTGR